MRLTLRYVPSSRYNPLSLTSIESQTTSTPKSEESRRRPHINSILSGENPRLHNMVYVNSTPIPSTNETMGRCPHLKRTGDSSHPSSSIVDQAGTSLYPPLDNGANRRLSVYHTHKSYTSNHSLGRIHFHYRANY
jgi:hypothetical protein